MVPEGWKHVTIGQIGRVVTGSTPPTDEDGYYGGDIPFVSPADLGSRKLIQTALKTLTSAGAAVSRLIPARSSLFVCIGSTIGKVGIAGRQLVTNQQINAVIPSQDHDPDFIYYQLSSRSKSIARLAGAQAVPIINKTQFSAEPIVVPPLPEQKKIADILSTWDAAIETTEKLLANTKGQKQALMQQLLDAREWPLRRLSELGQIQSAGVDKKIEAGQKPVRLLNYLDVFRRDFIYSDELTHWVTATDRQAVSCDIRKGDIFFTPSSETRDDIGHSAVSMEDIADGVYSYHVVRFRPSIDIDLKFRAYIFKSSHFYKQCYEWCEGSGQRYVIAQDYFRGFTVGFPPIADQKKIGECLFDLDSRMAILRTEIEQLQTEKRALMQELLTGKRRVTV